MDNVQTKLEKLYNNDNYQQRLLDIEDKRREYEGKKFLLGVLSFIMKVTFVILVITLLTSIMFLLSGENIFASILIILISGASIYGLFHGWSTIERYIDSLFSIYNSTFIEFRREAIISFTQIIYPNAKNIEFITARNFEYSSQDSLEFQSSGIFYNSFEDYTERNLLLFTIDSLTYKVGEIKAAFIVNPGHEATEFDRFMEFDRNSNQTFGIFAGICYRLPFLRAKESRTYLIPRKITPTPLKKRTKEVTGWDGKSSYKTVQVSQYYPSLEFSHKANNRSPGRFKRRGLEEYSMENDALEDQFYTFGEDQNATYKLLNFVLMERIVQVVSPPKNSQSENRIFSFSKNRDTWMYDFWFAMLRQRLLIAQQRNDLMFFTQIGKRSTEFENVVENFAKLKRILQPIDELDLFRTNAQNL